MSLLVIEPGLASTVQDRGRPGYRGLGVPPGGAFDLAAAEIANALLGNSGGRAVIEMTLVGGTYQAQATLALALAGATAIVRVDRADGPNLRFSPPVAFTLRKGDRLHVGPAPRGARTYLAVRGGWLTPLVLGSRSSEIRLRAGERLPCEEGTTPVRRLEAPAEGLSSGTPIRVIPGPDFALLTSEMASLVGEYRVDVESDRVGLRLRGPGWAIPVEPERISTPVAPGAIQVAGGQPLLLGVACGTMGGYPHVLHVISPDLGRVAQARPGDRLRFELVTVGQARRLDAEARRVHQRLCLCTAAAAED